MTDRDYFAMNAPDVPSWWKNPEQKKYPTIPHLDFKTDEQLQYYHLHYSDEDGKWYCANTDDIYNEMPAEEIDQDVKFIVDTYIRDRKACMEKREEIELHNNITRLISWRWYYADQMMEKCKYE